MIRCRDIRCFAFRCGQTVGQPDDTGLSGLRIRFVGLSPSESHPGRALAVESRADARFRSRVSRQQVLSERIGPSPSGEVAVTTLMPFPLLAK